ncbi:MAG: hypothetical protein HFJ75_07790 [Eggerthellaceae bacterium]|nr:hypothetical protein [Eggerthellaceae bacterium]
MASSLEVGTKLSDLREVPVEPDTINWGLNDISSSDAGRTQDANCTMYKHRIAQKRKLSLSWLNPTLEQTSTILKMFNPEYIFVRFVDPYEGHSVTREFYTGDKASPFKSITLNDPARTVLTSLSFDIVER